MLINFFGVCTHFWNHFIPGIPHRVVLANATSLRTGLLTGPFPLLLNPPGDPNNNPANPSSWIHYTLLPHFPIISQTFPDGTTVPLSSPGLLDDGRLITPSVLKITNAIPGMTYDPAFTDEVASLESFLTDYVPSTDVLTGGRVSAYFDLTGGTISAVTKQPAGATRGLPMSEPPVRRNSKSRLSRSSILNSRTSPSKSPALSTSRTLA